MKFRIPAVSRTLARMEPHGTSAVLLMVHQQMETVILWSLAKLELSIAKPKLLRMLLDIALR